MIAFKPRFFVLPAIALAALMMLHPADGGRSAGCGGPRSADAGIRASFARLQVSQSAAAAKICRVSANTLP